MSETTKEHRKDAQGQTRARSDANRETADVVRSKLHQHLQEMHEKERTTTRTAEQSAELAAKRGTLPVEQHIAELKKERRSHRVKAVLSAATGVAAVGFAVADAISFFTPADVVTLPLTAATIELWISGIGSLGLSYKSFAESRELTKQIKALEKRNLQLQEAMA